MKFFNKHQSLLANPKKEISLILDIRSSSIGVAFVAFEKDKIPVILHSYRKYVFFNDPPETVKFIDTMFALLKQIMDKMIYTELPVFASKSGETLTIKKVYTFFTSPWYRSFVYNVHKDFDKETKFSDSLIEEILKTNSEYKQDLDNFVEVEKKILNIKMNGYDVDEPLNKKTRNLDASLFSSFMSSDTVHDIENIIHKYIKGAPIYHYSHFGAIYSITSNVLREIEDYVLFDVNGELTDVFLVEDKATISHKIVSIGKNYFVRAIKKTCNLDYHSALSHIRMVSDGVLDDSCTSLVMSTLDSIENTWIDKTKEKIEDLSRAPGVIVVFCDSDISQIFKNMLEKTKTSQALWNSYTPKIIMLNNLITDQFAVDQSINKDEIIKAFAYYAFHSA
jgi:hypothetical protein